MLVSWNDHFALGIKEIDAGHGLVIETINLLNEANTPADNSRVATAMLPLLRQHMTAQFAAETVRLAAVDAETRAEHEAEHRRLLDVLDVIAQSQAEGKDMSGPLLLNLVCFLVSHLRGTDCDTYAPERFHRVAA